VRKKSSAGACGLRLFRKTRRARVAPFCRRPCTHVIKKSPDG
jgi:hypothetical protein